eukprot:s576_g33.t1
MAEAEVEGEEEEHGEGDDPPGDGGDDNNGDDIVAMVLNGHPLNGQVIDLNIELEGFDGGGGNEIRGVDLVRVAMQSHVNHLAIMRIQQEKQCRMYTNTVLSTTAPPTWLPSMPPWNPHPSSHA